MQECKIWVFLSFCFFFSFPLVLLSLHIIFLRFFMLFSIFIVCNIIMAKCHNSPLKQIVITFWNYAVFIFCENVTSHKGIFVSADFIYFFWAFDKIGLFCSYKKKKKNNLAKLLFESWQQNLFHNILEDIFVYLYRRKYTVFFIYSSLSRWKVINIKISWRFLLGQKNSGGLSYVIQIALNS